MDSTLKKLQVEIEMLEIKKSIFDAEKKILQFQNE